MMLLFEVIVTIVALLPANVNSYSSGAPSVVCDTLTPGHGAGAREIEVWCRHECYLNCYALYFFTPLYKANS